MIDTVRPLLVILVVAGVLFAEIQQSGSTTLTFDNQRVRCLFTLKIHSTLPRDSLVNLIFDYNSLVEFSKEVSVIRQLESGSNCYTVEFTIRYLLNEMVSTYNRCRSSDTSVTITMLSFRQTLNFLPSVTATHAGFTFATLPQGGTQIVYHQEILLNQPIEWIHYQVIKHKLRGFARDFEDFIRRHEQTNFSAIP